MSVMDVLGDVMDVADGEGHERRGRLIITLDGPAASGKSSVARRLAQRLGVPFVSSGLLYRAATYLVSDEVDPNDEAAVLDLLAAHEVNSSLSGVRLILFLLMMWTSLPSFTPPKLTPTSQRWRVTLRCAPGSTRDLERLKVTLSPKGATWVG